MMDMSYECDVRDVYVDGGNAENIECRRCANNRLVPGESDLGMFYDFFFLNNFPLLNYIHFNGLKSSNFF